VFISIGFLLDFNEYKKISIGISVSLKMDFQLVSHLVSKFQQVFSIGISVSLKKISIGIISFGIYFKKGKSFQKPS
jgi:uncharacterized metal-binding protein